MVDTTKLGRHAAVQMMRGEKPHDVARLVMNKLQSCKYQGLEVLGLVNVGSVTFVRFRTDASNLPEALEACIAEKRGVIREMSGQYRAVLGDGRSSAIASTFLLAVATPNEKKTYNGSAFKHWEAQFASS